MRSPKVLLLMLSALVLYASPALLRAQTASTAVLVGTLTDPTSGVVPDAEVELQDTASGFSRKTLSNPAGQYTFVALKPGHYTLTVRKDGFRKVIVSSIHLEVAKSFTLDLLLDIGEVSETSKIEAPVGAEMQTLDATVGEVISGQTLLHLPNLNRDATSFLLYEPFATPGRFETNIKGGQIAGARSDQNTFFIDGGDATSNADGNGGFNTRQAGIPRASVPTPAESVQEFRVGASTPNVTFGRSSGSPIFIVTRRGGSDLHGSAYGYYTGDNLSANSWTRGRLNQSNPRIRDNRFGGTLGGPVLKDKLFFFGNYEGHRTPQVAQVSRLVPTATLRQGILRFNDSTATVRSYDLKSATSCGPMSSSACDPRGLGISPVVRSVWSQFEPNGNDPSLGDGLNTIGFNAPLTYNLTENFGLGRLDYNFSDKWRFTGAVRYSKTRGFSPDQFDIGGLVCSQKGVPCATTSQRLQPRHFTVGATGQLKQNLTDEAHFTYTRNFWERAGRKPFPQVSGTAAALAINSEDAFSGLVPLDVDAQNAGDTVWNGHDYVFSDNATWIRGRHMVQFGGMAVRQQIFEQRDDKVRGALTSPVYQLSRGDSLAVPSMFRPPDCGGSVVANCLPTGDLNRWNSLYAATLGIVDSATVLAARDGSLNPLSPGVPLQTHLKTNEYEAYGGDTWRIGPSATLSFGLTWGVQLPPTERDRKQTLLADASTKQIYDAANYLNARQQAAQAGNVFNPQLAYLPISMAGRKYPYNPDWLNIGPRAAFAWSPRLTEGLPGMLFGSQRTVLRGGYSMTYDRINGISNVLTSILGAGFTDALTCRAPAMNGSCLGFGGTTPASAFRVGADGSAVPLPTLAAVTSPIIPSVNDPYEKLSIQVDPKLKIGRSHEFNFTIQREIPGNLSLEMGYAGRYSHRLPQGIDLNQVPFFMTDRRSGQSFSQAFDAVANALRSGNTVAPQAWFENLLAGSRFCAAPNPTCTAGVVANFASDFKVGDLFALWSGLDPSFVSGSTFAASRQVQSLYMLTDFGRSNYHAGFVTLHERGWRGLSFVANYTYSKTLDQVGLDQQYLASASNAYDLDFDYGPAPWDRRHVINVLASYDFPFGHKRRFWNGRGTFDKVLNGWSVSGIYSRASGLPLGVSQGTGEAWGSGYWGDNANAVAQSSIGFRPSVHSNVVSVGGIASDGIPAAGGTGLNFFLPPALVYSEFRRINISQDMRQGLSPLRGLARWNLDMVFAKDTQVTERVKVLFQAEFTNIFNHPLFSDPSLNLNDPAGFGVLNTQYNTPRTIQLGLRVAF